MYTLIILGAIGYAVYMNLNKKNNGVSYIEEVDNSTALINTKIRNIDVSDIREIILKPTNLPGISIKTKNFFKIVKAIVNETNKNVFKPNELRKIYEYVLQNYETSLPASSFIKISNTLDTFVSNGGSVEILHGTPDFPSTMPISEKPKSIFGIILKGFLIFFSIIATLGVIAVTGVILFCIVAFL